MKYLLAAFCVFLASSVSALDLALPASARLTAERDTALDRYHAPVGVFANDKVPTVVVEGEVRRAAYRIGTAGLTPLQIINPLKKQIEAAGYEVVLDCSAKSCGGFDFRYEVEVLPGPNMYVDLRSYHVLTAVRGSQNAPDAVVNVLASTAASSAYVQIITVGEAGVNTSTNSDVPIPAAQVVGLASRLDRQGHAVLSGLTFETGSDKLGKGPFRSLRQLADLLSARDTLKVGLVGHTDSVGSLESNIALSRARANAVRARLIEAYGVDGARLEAEGMGYLAPVASNLNAEGREANRRVEAIVLSE